MATASKRRALLTLFSVVVIDLIGFGIVIPILPFYAEDFGASATILGGLITVYAAMQFVFAPFWGRVSDRIGRRKVILITLAGTSLALLALGLSRSLVSLFAARILGGFFSANISVATAYVSDLAEDHERTRWMGLIGVAFGIGFVLGPTTGAILAPYGYHVPLLVAAVLAGINCVYALFTLQEPQRQAVAEVEPSEKALALRSRRVQRMSLINFLFTFGITQLEVTFAYFMLHRFGYDAQHVGYILGLMAVVMVLVQGGGIRRLAKFFGERRLLLAGALLLAVSIAPVPWMPTVALLLIPLMISSVGRGIAHPSMLTLVSEASSVANRGAVMGTFQSSAALARVVSPLVAGALYDAYDWSPFVLCGVLMIAVWGLALTLRRSPPVPASAPMAEAVGS